MVAKKPKPWLCAASNWLLGMELKPPRTISATTAEVNTVNATTETTKLEARIVK